METGAESLGEPAAPASANAVPPHRLPAGRVSGEQASPGGLPAEPLPLRRRRVLRDLGQARGNLRRQVAILAKNLGVLLGFERGRRIAPERSDYGRVGALAKQFGAREVWLTACRIAGLEIEGDALAYLQRRLEQEAPAAGNPPERRESSRAPAARAPHPDEAEASAAQPRPQRDSRARRNAPGSPETGPPPQRQIPAKPQEGDEPRGLGHLVHGAGRFGQERQQERSPYIANLVVDLSRQFGDLEHLLENDSQAHNLWRASGLDEEAFVQRVYEARRTTLQLAGARNRMAYFFTVLRNLLPPEETPAPPDISSDQSSTTGGRKKP